MRARDDLRPAAHARRQPRRGDPLRQRDRGDAAAAQQPEPGARARAEPACGRRRRERRRSPICTGLLEYAHGDDPATLARRPRLRLHHRARVGASAAAADASGTRSSRSGSSTLGSTSFPTRGVIVVEDAETGEQLVVDSSDADFRHRLREAGEHREAELRAATVRAGVDIYEVSTDDDLVSALVRIVESRKRRRALMSLGSPWMLLCLALVPVLVLAYVGLRATAVAERADRARGRRARADLGVPARSPLAAARPVRAVRGRARRSSASGSPARPMSFALPQRRGHGDPRLRRVEQHAGRRPRADADGGGEGGGHGLRRASSRARSGSASWRSATAPSPCCGRRP